MNLLPPAKCRRRSCITIHKDVEEKSSCEPTNIGETCLLLKVELVALFLFVKGEDNIHFA